MPKHLEALCKQIFMLRSHAYSVMGWEYQSPAMLPAPFAALRAYGLLYSDSGQFKSYGSIHGIGYDQQVFTLTDVTAQASQDGAYRGFGGIILSLDNSKNTKISFDGRVIICRDRGFLNPKSLQDMKRVGFVDRDFESRFEVYSHDQVESRALITPDLMERLMQFDDDYLGRNIQCAFIGGQLHICLEIDDRFDFNRMHIADSYEGIRAIVLHELAAVFTVLELGQRLQNTIGVQTADTMDKARGLYYAEQMERVKAALETQPETWKASAKIDPAFRYSHMLFDGHLGQMVKSVYAPLAPPKPETETS